MSTLKVNSITDTGDNPLLGRRNLIINGAMNVAQRGTSFSNANGYTLDRWKTYKNGAVAITTSQESDAPDGFSNSLKVAISTADTTVDSSDYVIVQYNIEGLDLQHLNYGSSSAKSITMSFWVKSNKTGDVTVTNEVNLGPPYSGKYFTINSANTWEYKTLTWSGNTTDSIDNDNGVGIEFQMWLHAGATFTGGTYTDDTWHSTGNNRVKSNFNFANSTSNTFQITGVQLEVGSVATPFEHRSYGEELTLCQRYYQQWGGNTGSERVMTGFYNSSNQVRITLPLHPNMRTTPSIGVTAHDDWKIEVSGSNTNTAHSLDQASPRVASINVTTNHTRSAGDSGQLIANDDGTQSSRLYLDAEL